MPKTDAHGALVSAPPPERADAARNRIRILEAADALFAAHGAEHVSMDEIAEAAGVGKGTLYRRFGDRAGLAVAVLDEKERRLQARILHGRPPLGPGGGPRARLHALLDAMIDLLERHTEIHVASEEGGARYRSGLYAFYRRTVEICLEQLGITSPLMPDIILAPLSADLFRHLRRDRGVPLREIRSSVRAAADAAIDEPRRGR